MEAIVFVLALVALGALALRFGQDSREGARCKEREFAAYGVTWTEVKPNGSAPAAEPARSYPTLAFIERALGAAGVLTADPSAALLETRARRLTTEYWSDRVWTTGVVPEASFRRVLAELAPALLDAPVSTVELPAGVAEAVGPAESAVALEREPAMQQRAVGVALAGSPAPA